MDWTIILTGAGTVIAVIGSNIALMSWLRADIKEIKSEASADRRDILQLTRNIQEETKDFHGKLCRLDERWRK
jgi:hypothetical protein